MEKVKMNYPTEKHEKYIEKIYECCTKNNFSMILKGSLVMGTATKFSDIDLILVGKDIGLKIDEIIDSYGIPVITNYTENPKGIFILIYEDGLSIDLDIREEISTEDLNGGTILLNKDIDSRISEKEVIRKEIKSKYMVKRPKWYKTLRLVHRALIKYLGYKTKDGYELLNELKETSLIRSYNDLKFNNDFRNDIELIFNRICSEFKLRLQLKQLFQNLIEELDNLEIWDEYDKEGFFTGEDLIRGQVLKEDSFHLVSEIIVKHKDGEYLLMQRDFSKNNYAGFYEATAGGAVLRGETPYEGAIRELKEETGIKENQLELIYKCFDKTVIYYGYICETNCDKNSIILQDKETRSYMWLDKDKFLKFVNSDKYVQVYRLRQESYLKSLMQK